MKRDIGMVLGIALVTFAVATLRLSYMPQAVADQEAPAAKPALVVDGIKIVVTLDKETYAPGERPTFKLTATNTGTTDAQLDGILQMTEVNTPNPMSRMPSITVPKSIWQQSCVATLAAGETKTLDLQPDLPVSVGKTYSIHITSKGNVRTVVEFTAVAPEKPPAS